MSSCRATNANAFAHAMPSHAPGATVAFRAYSGETWCEALARQSFHGCSSAWIRDRWTIVCDPLEKETKCH